MIYAFDTYYAGAVAKTVCVAFADWNDEVEVKVYDEVIAVPDEYESGAFYKRELPCLLSLLQKIDLQTGDVIVVDGYVTLSATRNGLGAYLYKELGEKYAVVGVAKNKFVDDDANRRTVLRGDSIKALFVTALGVDVDVVAECIKGMHGEFRMPTLLKLMDQLSRVPLEE